jgi:Kef-type K+ transport system membrane component KefB
MQQGLAELSSHGSETVQVLFSAAVILLAAKFGGEFMERLGGPAVLGELGAGVLLGNLAILGPQWFEPMRHNAGLELMAEIGVVLLLFEVGLESHLGQLLAVGPSSVIVAHIGVLVPMALGYAVTAVFLPQAPWYVHLFAGATLTATSVGITARVLHDLEKMATKEAQIILGAAVIDDVLGLIILAAASGVVGSVATGGAMVLEWGPVLIILGKALGFLAGAVLIGRRIHVNALRLAKSFRVPSMTIVLAICFCFGLSALSGWLGLAPIVGAFAAGLVLEDDDYADFVSRGVRPIHDLVQPIAAIFVPMFFVMMGLKANLRAFASMDILALAGALTLAAIIGKQACAFGVVDSGVSRITVGVGMIPRGEVGLIFAGMGASLAVGGKPVFDSALVSAMIVMVFLTTVITPPLLKALFGRRDSRASLVNERS